eukprot:CAMPEP_0197257314 /NCGR_PEP_ID=MMETSP1429-20130617/78281_1 /TAXON_ID=49237 /ORGANISM="Chaetoceros  sp., Strain UNC1202" /LENGTH=103 /DNA_ID=CAMNT_0042721117 /DNA_START=27 /DNA_END=335 /DNA_ORIENTATION=-
MGIGSNSQRVAMLRRSTEPLLNQIVGGGGKATDINITKLNIAFASFLDAEGGSPSSWLPKQQRIMASYFQSNKNTEHVQHGRILKSDSGMANRLATGDDASIN